MKIAVYEIKVGERLRKDAGDLTALIASINQIGLLHPVIINEKKELLSGFRRLEACRSLGFEEIDVTMIDTRDNAVKSLDLEYHENIGRVDLTTDESDHYFHRREDLIHPPKPAGRIRHWITSIWKKIRTLIYSLIRKNNHSGREESS